jgi:hypothetical protein
VTQQPELARLDDEKAAYRIAGREQHLAGIEAAGHT